VFFVVLALAVLVFNVSPFGPAQPVFAPGRRTFKPWQSVSGLAGFKKYSYRLLSLHVKPWDADGARDTFIRHDVHGLARDGLWHPQVGPLVHSLEPAASTACRPSSAWLLAPNAQVEMAPFSALFRQRQRDS
jgi:hypothetical protein